MINHKHYVSFLFALIFSKSVHCCPCCPISASCAAAPIKPYNIYIKLKFLKESSGLNLYVKPKCEAAFERTAKTPFIKGNTTSSFKIILCNNKQLIDSNLIQINKDYTGTCAITNVIKCYEKID